MTTRTIDRTVTFRRPFMIGGLDVALPSGDYIVETDKELLEGLSFPAYRRKLIPVYLHANSNRPICRQALPIDPDELDAALMRDQVADDDPVGADAEPVFETRRYGPLSEASEVRNGGLDDYFPEARCNRNSASMGQAEDPPMYAVQYRVPKCLVR